MNFTLQLEDKRSDYEGLLERHKRHHYCVDLIERELRYNLLYFL